MNKARVQTLSMALHSSIPEVAGLVLSTLSKVKSPLLMQCFIDVDSFMPTYAAISPSCCVYWWETTAYKQSRDSLLQSYESDREHRRIQALNISAMSYLLAVVTTGSKGQVDAVAVHAAEYQNGSVVKKLCQLAGCIDQESQRLACSLLSALGATSAIRDIIYREGWLFWLLSSFKHHKHTEDSSPLQALSVLSAYVSFSVLLSVLLLTLLQVLRALHGHSW